MELPTAAVTQMEPVLVDIAQIRSLAVASRAALEQMEGRPWNETGPLSLGEKGSMTGNEFAAAWAFPFQQATEFTSLRDYGEKECIKGMSDDMEEARGRSLFEGVLIFP